ncbi:hypothetical protein ACI6Q2_14360 [Chitinophagaceae bacterium LWZ2-11]
MMELLNRKCLLLFFTTIACFTKMQAQVDYQTGSAIYSIPVFSYADPKSGLSQSVSLNYSSGQGIRVAQLASNVGLGWALSAGGEIVRIQHGAPDDQYNPESIVNSADPQAVISQKDNPTLFDKYYPNGFLYKRFDIDYIPKEMAFQPRLGQNESGPVIKQAPKADEDTEQDVFILSVGGFAKEFVIGRNFEVKYSDGSLLKTTLIKEDISDRTLYNQNIITKITGFIVTDEAGVQYTFTKYDISELQRVDVNGINIKSLESRQVPTGKFMIDRWVLTSICDPVSGRCISYVYNTENTKYVPSISGSEIKQIMSNGGVSKGISQVYGNINSSRSVLSSITFPNTVQVFFSYKDNIRADLFGSKALNNITVYSNNVVLKKITLNTQYFYGKDIVPATGVSFDINNLTNGGTLYSPGYSFYDFNKVKASGMYRLALIGVNISNTNVPEDLNYTFDYYTGKDDSDPAFTMPSRVSSADQSGLYTGVDGFSYGCSVGGPTRYAAIGSLKSIKEPTGSSINYQYVVKPLMISNMNAVLVDQITVADSTSNSSYVKAYNYCLPGNPSSGLPIARSECSSGKAYTTYSNTFLGATEDVGCVQQYDVTYVKNSSFPNVAQMAFFNSANPVASAVQAIGTVVVSGLAVSATTTAVKSAVSQGGGIFFDNPYALAIKFVAPFVVNAFAAILDNLFSPGTTTLTFSTTANQPAIFNAPPPTTLAHISEYDVIGGTSYLSKEYKYNTTMSVGDSDYFFNETDDINTYTTSVRKNLFPYAAKQKVDPRKFGNLTSVKFYDRNLNEVYSKRVNYGYQKQTLDNNYRSVKYAPLKYYSNAYTDQSYKTVIGDDWIKSDSYNFISGYAYATKETEKTYNLAHTQQILSDKYYAYNSLNKQPSQVYTINSDGRVVGANTYYAINFWDQYPANTALQNLKSNNLVNTVSAVVSWYKNSLTDSKYYITGVSITDYDAVTLKPMSTKNARLQKPVDYLTQADLDGFNPYVTTGTWLNNLQYDVPSSNVYKDNMLVEVHGNNNTTVSAIKYDARNWQATATITNASFNQVSYTSFEHNDYDGWSLIAAGINADATAVTGDYVYNLGAGTITRTGIDASLPYRLTLWAKTNNVTANGAAGSVLFTANGWSLLQFEVGKIATLTITGNTQIDELRLLPMDARMQTVAYDAVRSQKISACDANNRLQYYEYDGWGRIKVIRDENKNIIKTQDYNLKK